MNYSNEVVKETRNNESNKAFVSKNINFESLDDLKKNVKIIRDIFKKETTNECGSCCTDIYEPDTSIQKLKKKTSFQAK